MPIPRQTKEQRRLVAEVKQLSSLLTLNPDEIMTEVDPEARTGRLRRAKDQIIRSAVIFNYILMDEQLNIVISWYFFGRKRSLQQHWRTKHFRTFSYFILEKLYLLQKLELVLSIHDIPRSVASDVKALNDLRNSVAHSFLTNYRRRKPEWKGQSVYTQDGFHRFVHDMGNLSSFFLTMFWTRNKS
jgi:hypothetical protein